MIVNYIKIRFLEIFMQTDEYIALSRKFRPLTFDDVTGHETVIEILKNQLATKSHCLHPGDRAR